MLKAVTSDISLWQLGNHCHSHAANTTHLQHLSKVYIYKKVYAGTIILEDISTLCFEEHTFVNELSETNAVSCESAGS